ncbi:S9 family peptidase [Priestia koreensis]|uniref:S9 family peptidase n=1 Tax=Priestia koreensis TaxID=284581 RepID=UPI00203AF63B|nr:S9 family peptidase [Priestia koreensis]MCM3006703.1 S9 family peptidase [Priestia koreensis]
MTVNKKRYLSIEEIVSVPSLSGTSISDDGKSIAFVKRTANWQENLYDHDIWIYEQEKGESYQLPVGGTGCTSPSWSPDSKSIAYLRGDENKNNQIFVQFIEDNREVQITNESEGVNEFKWDAVGKGFYYLAQAKEPVKRQALYEHFYEVAKEYRNNCLCYTPIDQKRQSIQLTDGQNFHIHEFALSNDGSRAVLIAAPTSKMEDYINRELYLLHLEERKVENLSIDKMLGEGICFSPNDHKICYTASTREKDHYRNHIQDGTIEMYDLHNGEVSRPLSNLDSIPVPICWTPKGILIRWQCKTNYCIGLFFEDGVIKPLSEEGFVLDVSSTSDGEHVAYSKAVEGEVFEIYWDHQKITNENSLFDEKFKSNREVISWKTSDGIEIEGVLSTPSTFDPNKAYPLLLIIHGGPNWASFPLFSDCFNEKYPIESFTEKGFIVLEPNYRGSSGYGNEFLKANYRTLGTVNYDDVISGVDVLIEKGIVDKARVGVMGWSNGGYISAFCSTFSNRFKAVSVGGGITDWHTNYVHTDLPYFTSMYLGDTPWNDPEIYAKTSPMTYIKSACTPTLIQHGERDARVPIANAYELYKGLKDMGVDTELIVFKDMAYSSDHPGVNATIMKQNLTWFTHYILGEPMKGFYSL